MISVECHQLLTNRKTEKSNLIIHKINEESEPEIKQLRFLG